MTVDTRAHLPYAGRLLVRAGTAAVVVAIFVTTALTFPGGGVDLASPEAIVTATLGTAVVLPRAQAVIARVAGRVTRGTTSTPYEALAEVAARMSTTLPVPQLTRHMEDMISSGVGADRVAVQVANEPVTRPRPGTGAAPVHIAQVSHRGEAVGWIEVHKTRGLSPHEVRLVKDLASSAGMALHTALSMSTLVTRADEIADAIREIDESRRLIVIAEQRHREALALDVTSRLSPVFDELRSHVRADDLDSAAATAEVLVESLRSVSTVVLQSASP